MARPIAIDLCRALAVLALIFLSFGHAPLPASAGAATGSVLTAAVDLGYCGSPVDDGKAHAPCHACRIGGGADLPPAPACAIPVVQVATVAYGALPVLSLPAVAVTPYGARAPPIA